MTKIYRKGNGFLSHIYFNVALPSSHGEATLNHTIHVTSVLSCDMFYLQAKVSPLKISLGNTLLQKISGQRSFTQRGASIRHTRVHGLSCGQRGVITHWAQAEILVAQCIMFVNGDEMRAKLNIIFQCSKRKHKIYSKLFCFEIVRY